MSVKFVAAFATVTSEANSEELPAESVATAERNWPALTWTGTIVEKVAEPLTSVVIGCDWPRYTCPSPNPEGSAALLAKYWIVNTVFGVESRVAETVVEVGPVSADFRTG